MFNTIKNFCEYVYKKSKPSSFFGESKPKNLKKLFALACILTLATASQDTDIQSNMNPSNNGTTPGFLTIGTGNFLYY